MEKNHAINTKILIISVIIAGIIFIILSGLYFFSGKTCDIKPVYLDEKKTISSRAVKENTENYSINVSYPAITLENKEAQDKINQEIESIVNSEVSFFKDAHDEMGTTGMDWMVSALNMDYGVSLLTNKTISILFTKDRYISGAAHPIMGYDVLNYDLKNNKQISLADIFKDYPDYLEKISEYCKQILAVKVGEFGLNEDGVSADEENFKKFIIKDNSVVILFEPYQVAAYAAGSQEVEVPFDLSNLKAEKQIVGPISANDIQSFEDCIAAGFPAMESYPRQCAIPEGQTFTENIGNELEKQDLIIADQPRPNAVVSSPLTITGQARGNWYFEATFPIELYNESGDLIANSFATAKGEWMTEDFVPFEAILQFPKTAGKGTLILKKDNPSGLPEYDDQLVIPVSFK